MYINDKKKCRFILFKLFKKKMVPVEIYNSRISWLMVFNATFNNISLISWRSVLLVEEAGENHRPAVSH
jgi:hypothetical protein